MPQDSTVAIVAIAVTGSVSLIAAVLAPVTAHIRQQRSLTAEFERQKRQLSHDRLLRDLEETRTRLDETIDMGEAALSAVCEARLAFNAGNQQACDDQFWQARNCLGQYGYKERRVRLRVGNEPALIASLADYRTAVQSLYNLAHDAISKGSAVAGDTWNVAMAKVGHAQLAVIEAGQESVGARIHSDVVSTK